jgi:hypothetical protein
VSVQPEKTVAVVKVEIKTDKQFVLSGAHLYAFTRSISQKSLEKVTISNVACGIILKVVDLLTGLHRLDHRPVTSG